MNPMQAETVRVLAQALDCEVDEIEEASLTEDRNLNVDFHTPKGDVSARVRSHGYVASFGHEFTLRYARPRRSTELEKALNGLGAFFFYAFSDADEVSFVRWTLADLDVFRLWHALFVKEHGREPGQLIENFDESSTFRVYRWADLPREVVVANSGWLDQPRPGP